MRDSFGFSPNGWGRYSDEFGFGWDGDYASYGYSEGHYHDNEGDEDTHSTYSDEGESDEYDIDEDVYAYRDNGANSRDDEPYCLRCDRHFRTSYGYRDHCRMSSMHPWWCDECDTDFEREADLEVRAFLYLPLHSC